jgi:hypothetical protein
MRVTLELSIKWQQPEWAVTGELLGGKMAAPSQFQQTRGEEWRGPPEQRVEQMCLLKKASQADFVRSAKLAQTVRHLPWTMNFTKHAA